MSCFSSGTLASQHTATRWWQHSYMPSDTKKKEQTSSLQRQPAGGLAGVSMLASAHLTLAHCVKPLHLLGRFPALTRSDPLRVAQ